MKKDIWKHLHDIASKYRHNILELKTLTDYNKKIATMILDNEKDISKLNNLELFELLGDITLEELKELVKDEQ